MSSAIFFLSTGRCGTQWLASVLSEIYADSAVVTHEPIKGTYAPKKYLRQTQRHFELLEIDEFRVHYEFIKNTLDSGKYYLETGWPCYPAIPLFNRLFEGKIKVIHIVRHPVCAALSMATHNVYNRTDWIQKCAIDPTDEGVIQKPLKSHWHKMTMYEKLLFWWTEINLYALELNRNYPDIPYLLIKYEDLFGHSRNETINTIMKFIGLTNAAIVESKKISKIDKYVFKMDYVDWRLIYNYPVTIELAKAFGYDLEHIDSNALRKRYFYSSIYDKHINRLIRWMRRFIKKLTQK